LFKLELYGNSVYKEIKSREVITRVLKKIIEPLAEKLIVTVGKFDEFFLQRKNFINVIFNSGRSERFREFNKSLYDFLYDKYPKEYNYQYRGLIVEVLKLEFEYSKFKNPKNEFDLVVSIYIQFKDSHYEILDNNEDLLFVKFYHEDISVPEFKLISKNLVADIKNCINESIKKSPKS